MIESVKKIEDELTFSKKFTFCTLVTRLEEYLEMVESAKQKGFDGDDIEFLYFDNAASNQFDGFSGVNRAIKTAQGKYLIFCHQDLLFKYDNREHLERCLEQLSMLDPHWAVAGNAGRCMNGRHYVRISDPHGDSINEGPFPQEVMSVDENFFIINQQVNIASTSMLKGFHLYGLDLCQNAKYLGLKSYAIDFHLFHKSGGNVDKGYFDIQRRYMDVQQERKTEQWFFPMCSVFFVSSSRLLNWWLNIKRVRKLLNKKQ